MNCGNLAIVFGPNLLGGDIDGNNAIGTKVCFSDFFCFVTLSREKSPLRKLFSDRRNTVKTCIEAIWVPSC